MIVGSGPAGAALALILARRGIEVVLLERQTDFGREFRGEGLMETGVDAIAQMGLGAALDALPHNILRAIDIYVDKRGPFRLAAERPEQDLGIRMVSQPLVLEMMVSQASRFPSFRLERGATVRDLIYENGRAAGVRVESSSEAYELRADLVIGADGRNSVLRKRAGLHKERFPQFFDVVWAKVPLPDFLSDRRTARAYLGRNHGALCFPAADGKLQIGWIIDKGSFGELRARGVEAWLKQMAEFVSADLAAHLRANLEAISHPFLLNVICDRLVRWTTPGLLLLGDAAHPMSPVGAQGINVALRDALVAANHLCPVLLDQAEPAAIDSAAFRVQGERLPEVAAIQELQDSLPPILFGTGWWRRIVRLLVLATLRHPGLARRGFEAMRSRFAHGIREVRLQV